MLFVCTTKGILENAGEQHNESTTVSSRQIIFRVSYELESATLSFKNVDTLCARGVSV